MSQPLQTYEWGPVEEVMFSSTATGATKSRWLVQPDTYSKRGLTVGRSARLGEPINLGPNSTWRQTTWEGGELQEQWRDDAMYFRGTADVSSDRGKVKMNCALGDLGLGLTARTHVNRLILGRNALNIFRTTPLPLFMGECGAGDTTPPTGGWKLYRKDPGGALTTLGTTTAGDFAAMSPVDDNSPALYVANNLYSGVNAGKSLISAYNQTTGASSLVYLETAGPVAENGMVFFNNTLFWLAGNIVRKRFNDGVTIKTDQLFQAAGCALTRGAEVWNNRLWFGGITASSHTRIYTSDGTQTVMAFAIPDEFHIHCMKAHYGSLYIGGSKPAADRTGWIGQVWRYTGTQLKLLWEYGTKDNEIGEEHTVWDMAAFGNILCWPRQGRASNNYAAGLVYYDAEVDAISNGPNDYGLVLSNVDITSVENYDQTIVVSAKEQATNNIYARPVRKLGRLKRTTATVLQSVVSSTFDGELPGEEKVWLTGRIRAKLDSSTANFLNVYVYMDDATTPVLITQLTTSSGLAGKWQTFIFPMKDSGGNYIKCTTLRYQLDFVNNEVNVESVANVTVDSVEVEYMPSPVKRREWRVRIVCNNNQLQLDGTANSLTTTEQMVDALESLWATQRPLRFWDKTATPHDNVVAHTTEVMIQDFVVQKRLLDNQGTASVAEVALTLWEPANA